MKNFVKFDFTKQDILDSFDIFMEQAEHKKKKYYFNEIIYEFLQFMEDDIIESYQDEKTINQCKKYIKNTLYNNEKYLYDKYGEK